MQFIIKSKIHPDLYQTLIAINQGYYMSVKYAGDDILVGNVQGTTWEDVEQYFANVCVISGNVYELVGQDRHIREITVYIRNGSIHHMRIERYYKVVRKSSLPARRSVTYIYHHGNDAVDNSQCLLCKALEIIMCQGIPVVMQRG
jgi:hypothetical protein